MQPECRVYLAMTKCDLLEDPPALGPADAATHAAGSEDSAGRPLGSPAANPAKMYFTCRVRHEAPRSQCFRHFVSVQAQDTHHTGMQ